MNRCNRIPPSRRYLRISCAGTWRVKSVSRIPPPLVISESSTGYLIIDENSWSFYFGSPLAEYAIRWHWTLAGFSVRVVAMQSSCTWRRYLWLPLESPRGTERQSVGGNQVVECPFGTLSAPRSCFCVGQAWRMTLATQTLIFPWSTPHMSLGLLRKNFPKNP